MRTIEVGDKVYAQLQELLKEEQPGQIERYGKPISETPEDMIPWLIGFYRAEKEVPGKD